MIYTTNAERKTFTLKDGAEMSYLELGEGQPMVLIHGWSQSGLQWYNQIEEFSKTYRVLALDLRGHGQSSKVENGYRAYRLAQDVREFMTGLDLEPAVLMGHSMGCTILWAYWDMYEGDGVDKMMFIDNSPYPADIPINVGVHAIKGLTAEAIPQMAQGWASDKDGSFSRNFLRQQMTASVPDEVFEKAFEQHLLLGRRHAADLFVNLQGEDLRDVLPRVTVPSLYIGGKASLVNSESIIEQAKQAPQGSYELFEENEGGAHFMFLENPTKFNKVVSEFLDKHSFKKTKIKGQRK